ncbi:hypothetical protein Tco_0556097, partial [Tanacetum coccineum]
ESIQTALYAHGDEVEALHSQFLMSQYPELNSSASGTHFLHKWENSKTMIQFTPSHT